MSKLKDMEAAVGVRRPRQATKDDVAKTIFGRMGEETAAPQLLPMAQIVRSRFQSRGRRDNEYVENLAESIRQEGLLDPIIVRPIDPARQGDGEGCNTITPPQQCYELVAGHNRFDAYTLLGNTEIPAVIRHMSDAEAARALTAENTLRKNLGDWELFKHMEMLREIGAVKNNTDLARVLNVNRVVVQYLDAFSVLPQAARDLLDDHPALVGYNLAQKLKPYCPDNEIIVFDALCLLAQKRISQAGVPDWIEKKVHPQQARPRKEFDLSGVRLVVTPDGARVSGNIDYDRLHKLIEDNLPQLIKPAV